MSLIKWKDKEKQFRTQILLCGIVLFLIVLPLFNPSILEEISFNLSRCKISVGGGTLLTDLAVYSDIILNCSELISIILLFIKIAYLIEVGLLLYFMMIKHEELEPVSFQQKYNRKNFLVGSNQPTYIIQSRFLC